MNTFFYLASCSTCAKIMNAIEVEKYKINLREIKSSSITEDELNTMIELAGSAESLFSRVAMKYRAWGLNEKKLTEKDYKKYILEEYTFLKRPVLVYKNKIYIGNTKANVEAMQNALKGK